MPQWSVLIWNAIAVIQIQWQGAAVRRDPVLDVVDVIRGCYEMYKKPIHLVYTNANYVSGRSVHAGWQRLLAQFDRAPQIRMRTYTYPVFSSDRINGRGNITDWRSRRFTYPATRAPAEMPCDCQTVP